MQSVLQIHPKDNVLVALKDFEQNEKVQFGGETYQVIEPIPIKHKFSMQDLQVGEPIYMYGVLVGKAMVPIAKGARIAVENTAHATEAYGVERQAYQWTAPDISRFEGRTFNGYHRKDGKVGTMNYWLVIPLVFCENRNLKVIREAMLEALGYASEGDFSVDTADLIQRYQAGASADDILNAEIIKSGTEIQRNRIFPNVDGIKFLSHEGGCGGTVHDSQTLCRLLAGYILSPNVAGATVLSLGCQHAQIKLLQDSINKVDPNFAKPIYYLEQQKSKSERDFIGEAVKKTFVGLMQANEVSRQPAGLEHLTLGLECGGSDGFSGITANPALGYASDLIVALGGKTILSEFPELNGVEQELINRAVEKPVAEKFATLMKNYSDAAESVGAGFYMNPSPGNIKDGLITDAIKSAGAARKGGTSPVADVLDYTEPVTKAGLNLLCTPGNDVESTTGLAGSGANVIAFTTGLGTPTGNPISPTVKIATNSALAERMPDIIDVNAGTIVSEGDSLQAKGEEILEYLIQVASGEATPHAVRLGQDDFIPWKRGVSL